jgi:hypothetical protein
MAKPFDLKLTPDRGASGRSVGIGPTQTNTLSEDIINPDMIALPGFPSRQAKLLSGTDDVSPPAAEVKTTMRQRMTRKRKLMKPKQWK